MAKKDKNKKGDDVLKYEMKLALQNEIKTLESLIFIEQQKIIYNTSQKTKSQIEMENEINDTQKLSIDESKKISTDGDNLKNVVSAFKKDVDLLEKQIKEDDDEIRRLEHEIFLMEANFKKELEDKDNQIAEQRKTFENLSIKFQEILQRTANKLQERVDMGR